MPRPSGSMRLAQRLAQEAALASARECLGDGDDAVYAVVMVVAESILGPFAQNACTCSIS